MPETTLCIIKPDAMRAGAAGKIMDMVIQSGLRVVAARMVHLSLGAARGFYHVHERRPFFADLTAFMSQGPVLAMALEGDGAISRWRALMGATDPAEAAEGTVRRLYGTSKQCNAVHGSDAPETAAFETGYFFSSLDMVGN